MENSISLRDIAYIPVGPVESARKWIGFDGTHCAFVLEVTRQKAKPRHSATIYSPTRGTIFQSPMAGGAISVHGDMRQMELRVGLPRNAPAAGPDLLALALDCIHAEFDAPEARLERGSHAQMIAVICAMEAIMYRRGCWADPGNMIAYSVSCLQPQDSRVEPGAAIFENDVIDYFRPISKRPNKWDPSWDGPRLSLLRQPPAKDITAHDLLEFSDIVVAFYRKAKDILRLSPDALERRSLSLGMDLARI